MAITDRIVDQNSQDAPGDLNALENSLRTATTSPAKEPAKPDEAAQTAPVKAKAEKPEWMPDKFWTGDYDASVSRMADGYRNIESAYGRMANDLGTQRKFTDRILALDKRASDLDGKPVRKPVKVDPAKLVNNPTEALDEYFSTREKELRADWEKERRESELAQAERYFLSRHPDFQATTQTAEFAKWVQSSPLRQRAAVLAAQGDYSVADELLTEYEASTGKGPAPVVRDEQGKVQDDVEGARKAQLETSAQAKGSPATTKSGIIYRRSDLIRLKMEKPEVYGDPSFQAEIMAAYAQGRVK